ncbi:hypothetical protein FBU31_002050 [Coemansia sp. 'formosensis']|nr:hypothetical protein FBU31_002050 [Coemansia sp. 'formosensis']
MSAVMPFSSMSAEQNVAILFQQLQDASNKDNTGEKTAQLDHALQAAQLAKNDGADEETILAVLLYNIAPPSPLMEQSSDTHWAQISVIGQTGVSNDLDNCVSRSEYLRLLGFPTKICDLIESRSSVTRYLSAKDPAYLVSLSNSRKKSLELQEGPFTPTEMSEFEENPLFKQMLQVRKWDDDAKATGIKPLTLKTYLDMATRNVKPMNQADPLMFTPISLNF